MLVQVWPYYSPKGSLSVFEIRATPMQSSQKLASLIDVIRFVPKLKPGQKTPPQEINYIH